jgi:hypothetical protein
VVCASIPQEERSIWQFDQVQKVVDEKWESLEPAETSRSGFFTRLHDIWQYQACPLNMEHPAYCTAATMITALPTGI